MSLARATGLFAALALAAGEAGGQPVGSTSPVRNTSFVLPSGERVLRHEAELAAKPDEVWRTLTTTEGLRSFLAPVVSIDLRVGGFWEASYDPRRSIGDPGNILNEILAYLPPELLVVRIARTPPGFPHAEVAKAVRTVYQLRPAEGGRTHLSVSMVGWQSGPDWDAVYGFFDRGNAETMASLQRRFISSPRQWPASGR